MAAKKLERWGRGNLRTMNNAAMRQRTLNKQRGDVRAGTLRPLRCPGFVVDEGVAVGFPTGGFVKGIRGSPKVPGQCNDDERNPRNSPIFNSQIKVKSQCVSPFCFKALSFPE
jgi:hypothetical protein